MPSHGVIELFKCPLTLILSFYVTAIQQEKREVNIRKSLTEFEKGNLKHVKTEEKNPLPDATGRTLSS